MSGAGRELTPQEVLADLLGSGLQSQPRQPRAREDPLNMVCPSILASIPASMLNQNSPDLGIPNRVDLKASRFSRRALRRRALTST
jgi:hypothetical protein